MKKSFLLVLTLQSIQADEDVCSEVDTTFTNCLQEHPECTPSCIPDKFTDTTSASPCEIMQQAMCCCPSCESELREAFQCELNKFEPPTTCDLQCRQACTEDGDANKALQVCIAKNMVHGCSASCWSPEERARAEQERLLRTKNTFQDVLCSQYQEVSCCCPACHREFRESLEKSSEVELRLDACQLPCALNASVANQTDLPLSMSNRTSIYAKNRLRHQEG